MVRPARACPIQRDARYRRSLMTSMRIERGDDDRPAFDNAGHDGLPAGSFFEACVGDAVRAREMAPYAAERGPAQRARKAEWLGYVERFGERVQVILERKRILINHVVGSGRKFKRGGDGAARVRDVNRGDVVAARSRLYKQPALHHADHVDGLDGLGSVESSEAEHNASAAGF